MWLAGRPAGRAAAFDLEGWPPCFTEPGDGDGRCGLDPHCAAILLTAAPTAGPGGGRGELAVPFRAMWISPREAVAVMLRVLIRMDFAAMRTWRAHADRNDLRRLPG